MSPPEEREDGRILLLTLAFAVVLLGLVLTLGSVASVYLERKQLLALADAMAADAADALDRDAYYAAGAGEFRLTTASVRADAEAYLRAAPGSLVADYDALALTEPTGSTDGRAANVTLTAVVRPPLIPWAIVPWSDGIRITVTASARAEP